MITVPCSTSIGAAIISGSNLQRLFFVWKSESLFVRANSGNSLVSAPHVSYCYKYSSKDTATMQLNRRWFLYLLIPSRSHFKVQQTFQFFSEFCIPF